MIGWIVDIAFFDFDGTITRGDSFALFLKFILGPRFYSKVALNLHVLMQYKLGMIDNHKAKEHFLKACIGGMLEQELLEKCNAFKDKLLAYCKQSALDRIRWHLDNNHKVVMVSASFEEYLRPLCDSLQISLLATTMEIKDSRITGYFAKPNCYGVQKEIRIKEAYDLSKYDNIYAYGDTRGDKEMLALASPGLAFFRIFT